MPLATTALQESRYFWGFVKGGPKSSLSFCANLFNLRTLSYIAAFVLLSTCSFSRRMNTAKIADTEGWWGRERICQELRKRFFSPHPPPPPTHTHNQSYKSAHHSSQHYHHNLHFESSVWHLHCWIEKKEYTPINIILIQQQVWTLDFQLFDSFHARKKLLMYMY